MQAQYASKDGYEGQWKADKKQGFGTFWSASGEVYEGQWLTGTYEGHGTSLYASSDVYEGQYKGGKRDGRGVYMYASTLSSAAWSRKQECADTCTRGMHMCI